MKLHHIRLTSDNKVIDYILPLQENEVFNAMKALTQLHTAIHGGSWRGLGSLAV